MRLPAPLSASWPNSWLMRSIVWRPCVMEVKNCPDERATAASTLSPSIIRPSTARLFRT